MEIRLAKGRYKPISARNRARIPKLALSFVGSLDLAPIQNDFGEDMTRRSGQRAWDQLITGALQ